jgi:tetratricopeptide (TPR) repeat protein
MLAAMSGAAEAMHTREAFDALKRSAWAEAVERFGAADAAGVLTPDELRSYGEAALWCQRGDLAIELYERACAGYTAKGDKAGAADVALRLANGHMHKRQMAIGSGWFRRAERLLADSPECAAHAQLAFIQSMMAGGRGELDVALELADKSLAIAERIGDLDSQALALLRRGRVLVQQGKLAQGMADIDEAMVAAVSGELHPMITGTIYCATISACHELCDYDRAGEWTEAARRWCERKSITGFPGICRVHRAEILRLRGRWEEAETEATRAAGELRDFGLLDTSGEAFYEIGEIRLRMGDLDEAEDAFRQAQELGKDPQPGLALLWLERGKVETAKGMIARAVEETPQARKLLRVRLLPAQVEIALAAGDVATARAAADELEETSKEFRTVGIDAAAATARGALQIATGDPATAITTLRRACALWKQVDAPYESAQARLLLAKAYQAHGDEETAKAETKAARQTLERLGAVLALQRTAEAPADSAPRPTQSVSFEAGPMPGDVLDDRIELLRLIGGGGMGRVFEGRNRRTGRHVAVKLLRSDLTTDPAACQRLLQEALACGRIQHPNVVDVYDAGIHLRRPYVVMELLRGESLGERLDRDKMLETKCAVSLILQALTGIGAAHRANTIHRDIKPDNLFLMDNGAGTEPTVKVLDFGISKLIGPESTLTDTKTGMIVGTPFYMSPEQAMGKKEIDHRTDIYGLGAVLFHALTGTTPFNGENYNALLAAIITTEVPRPRSLRSDIPLALEAVILRAMARDPAMRYPNADELAGDLRAVLG